MQPMTGFYDHLQGYLLVNALGTSLTLHKTNRLLWSWWNIHRRQGAFYSRNEMIHLKTRMLGAWNRCTVLTSSYPYRAGIRSRQTCMWGDVTKFAFCLVEVYHICLIDIFLLVYIVYLFCCIMLLCILTITRQHVVLFADTYYII